MALIFALVVLWTLVDAYLTWEKLTILGPESEMNFVVRQAARVSPALAGSVVLSMGIVTGLVCGWIGRDFLAGYAGCKLSMVIMHHKANVIFKQLKDEFDNERQNTAD
jgi:hypothetical protein